MTKLFRLMITAAVAIGSASVASAGELKLSITNGRVTLVAQDVQVRQILAEWTRVGGTTIVGGDKLVGQNVTLQLVDQPEREALEILLKSAAGYVASQRAQILPNASVFDRILILPTSRPPAYSASAPPPATFARPMPQPQPDDDEPVEPVPLTPPQAPPGAAFPGNQPGMQPAAPGTSPQQPVTASKPGMLPAAPGVPPNPYGAPPGVPPNPNPNGRGGGPGGPGAPGTGRGGQR
jgi:hypothetical protein